MTTIHTSVPDLVIDSASFVPYYQQISDQVRELIRRGVLEQGKTFYSEGEVAAMLGISKMPVRQAFQKLRSEGWLVIARGRKPVIGAGRVRWNFQELQGFTEEMRQRGLKPSARVLTMELRTPDSETVAALGLEEGAQIHFLRRLRLIDGEPVAIVESHFPAKLFPGLERHNLAGSVYQIIEGVYQRKLGYAEEMIGAMNAGPEEAEVLETEPGAALLVIRETSYGVDRRPLEYSVSFLRGDRYNASVIAVRKK